MLCNALYRREAGKRCMACTRCGEDRQVDVEEWDLPPPCRACKRSSVVEDQIQVTAVTISHLTSNIFSLQLEKYKKHYLLLTQKGGLNMSEMSYDYLSAWCAKEMDTVFGKG